MAEEKKNKVKRINVIVFFFIEIKVEHYRWLCEHVLLLIARMRWLDILDNQMNTHFLYEKDQQYFLLVA